MNKRYVTISGNVKKENNIDTMFQYSLSRIRPPLVHEKGVTSERWSLKAQNCIDNQQQLLHKVITLLAKIRQIDKAVPIKTNSFWV